jgi:hypothetical protein
MYYLRTDIANVSGQGYNLLKEERPAQPTGESWPDWARISDVSYRSGDWSDVITKTRVNQLKLDDEEVTCL